MRGYLFPVIGTARQVFFKLNFVVHTCNFRWLNLNFPSSAVRTFQAESQFLGLASQQWDKCALHAKITFRFWIQQLMSDVSPENGSRSQ